MCVQSSEDVGHRNVKGAWRRRREECWDPNMCRSLPAAHLLLISCRPFLPMASTWTQTSPRWTLERWKDVYIPYLGGDPLQWKRYSKEWNEETASERNKRAEISSSTLVGRMSAWALTWLVPNISERRFLITFVKLSNKRHWLWIMPQGNFLASVPEITLIPVKLTLCKVSRQKLNPRFSLQMSH